MTREKIIKGLNAINKECGRHHGEGFAWMAEIVQEAIKALEQEPCEDCETITVSKGTLKARKGRFVVYDVEWLKEHFNTTEAKLYGNSCEDDKPCTECPKYDKEKHYCPHFCHVIRNVFEEQEPMLDKIRAEITNIPTTDSDGHFNNWYREPQAIINDVLRIIDKYKAESEGV